LSYGKALTGLHHLPWWYRYGGRRKFLMRKRLWLCGAALVLAALAAAADASGTWKAEFTSPDGAQRVNTFKFKVEGTKLTGTVAGSQDETPIQDGKVTGDEISFAAERPFGKFTYQGKVNGDEIKFKVDFDGSNFDITAKRISK
jgi:hypothetical protein